VNSELKQNEEDLKRLQLKRKEKEIDLEQKENAIKKLQVQLYQVKTNKEYTAIENETAGLKADKSVLEEEILKIFDEIEASEKKVSDKKKELSEEKKKIEENKRRIDSEKQAIEKELARLEERRKTITPLIDKNTLSKYERILHGKDGLALVPIKGENCGGCYVNLPPQVINEIRLKENIIYCERCARMLYAGD
jgi:predicted  nucleic acid-binding Zn-ribbon protein